MAAAAEAFASRRWRARWIWCETPRLDLRALGNASVDPQTSQRMACFRRNLHLETVPDSVPSRITADSRYILWVNGNEVSRGPVRSNPRRLHYDPLDLASHLREGPNALAVMVRFYGHPTPWWMPAPGTLQLGAGSLVFEACLGDEVWLVTDTSWRALASDAWEQQTPRGIGGMSPECHDGRLLPAEWRDIHFDDSGWSRAFPLQANAIGFPGRHEPPSHPFGPLLPRPIPPLSVHRREARAIRVAVSSRKSDPADPVEQVQSDLSDARVRSLAKAGKSLSLEGAPGAVQILTFDFGQVVSGTAVLDVDAPEGSTFDLAASEFLKDDGGLDPDDQHNGFRYVARGSQDRFETFDPIGLRYAALSIRADGPVFVRGLSVKERLYPRPSGPFFQCSDNTLNKIWLAGRRTVDLCSHDAYLDCPSREQRAWTGDFVVHQMVDLATNPDWGLARWAVELAASPRPDGMLPMAVAGDFEYADGAFIPDWALHWIRALHNLYRYTGDRDLVARHLPVAENVLRWFVPFQGREGLLCDVTGWVIIDWSSVSVDGCSSALNGLWARGLRDFAEMSEWLGDTARGDWARGVHARVREAFEAFWDSGRGVYVDHLVPGERRRAFSQHAQAAPLAAGLVPGDRVERLVEVLTDPSRNVHATWSRAHGDARSPRPGEKGVSGPYLLAGPPEPWWDVEKQMVVAQPFFRYVVHDALVEAGRTDLIPSQCLDWKALFKRSETSWSETWYGGTTCHGWCSTPTRDLSTRTLGITPAEPGFGVARIAPRLGPLAWARGAVPTPSGPISVDVNPERIEVESPVAFDLDGGDGSVTRHPAGRQTFRLP
jgi:hypothetical protein